MLGVDQGKIIWVLSPTVYELVGGTRAADQSPEDALEDVITSWRSQTIEQQTKAQVAMLDIVKKLFVTLLTPINATAFWTEVAAEHMLP